MRDTAVILAAAGTSSRFGHPFEKKVFSMLAGKAVWQHSAETFARSASVGQQILVLHPDDTSILHTNFADLIAALKIEIAVGGNHRWQSVRNAIDKLDDAIEFVAVHDAARPLIKRSDFESVLAAAREHGAAILGDPIYGTVKRTESYGFICETVSRERLFQAQTPQIVRRDWLEEAYATMNPELAPTDESMLMESFGRRVKVVVGSSTNLKITTQEDLKLAELLKEKASSMLES